MSTLERYRSQACPLCGQKKLLQIGDAHYAVVPLFEDAVEQVRRAPDLSCYVKACEYCGHMEFFSKTLIDRFLKAEEQSEQFGEISRGPDGQYLISIYVNYVHRGVSSTDFTVPLDAEAWFQVSITLDSLSDAELVNAVLAGPYREAWLARVGAIPPTLGSSLRALIRRHLERHSTGSKVGEPAV